MKIGKLRLRGVEKRGERYIAVHRTTAGQTTIGTYSTREEAGRAFDAHLIQKRGMAAFSQLNYPEEHRTAYLDYLAAEDEKRRLEANMLEQRLRDTVVPNEEYPRLQDLHLRGTPISELANIYRTHPDNIVETLRKIELDRLKALGIFVTPVIRDDECA